MIHIVKLLDTDECEMVSRDCDNLKQAKAEANLLLTDPEYLAAGAYKVEVYNEHRECVWDQCVK